MRNGREGANTGQILKPVKMNNWGSVPLKNTGIQCLIFTSELPRPKVQGTCGIHPSTPVGHCLRAAPEVGGINFQAQGQPKQASEAKGKPSAKKCRCWWL